MHKSTVIAQCLLNSSMVASLQQGEEVVQEIFDENFEGQNFSKWNTQIADKTGHSIIQGLGRAMCINVKLFIADLSADALQDGALPKQSNADQALVRIFSSDASRSGIGGARFNGRT